MKNVRPFDDLTFFMEIRRPLFSIFEQESQLHCATVFAILNLMNHVSAGDNDAMDLVNKDDQVIGTINQTDAHKLLDTKAGFVRGTAALIQNDNGQLWIPRRVVNKRVAPNGLDFSVSEHVQSGETYQQGLIRGFREELFLKVAPDALQFLGKLGPVPAAPYFFTSVFLYKANEVRSYNQADFSGAVWLDPDEIVSRIDNGEPCKDALGAAIQLLVA